MHPTIYLLERYIPKNVFFLREVVLIYDAPSLPRKDTRFDQELPSIRGSKVWRKGSRPVAWLAGGRDPGFGQQLPLRGGFNLRCTRPISNGVKGLDHVK